LSTICGGLVNGEWGVHIAATSAGSLFTFLFSFAFFPLPFTWAA